MASDAWALIHDDSAGADYYWSPAENVVAWQLPDTAAEATSVAPAQAGAAVQAHAGGTCDAALGVHGPLPAPAPPEQASEQRAEEAEERTAHAGAPPGGYHAGNQSEASAPEHGHALQAAPSGGDEASALPDGAGEPADSLPEGWQAVEDPESGDTYYWHPGTDLTQWEHPAGPVTAAVAEVDQAAEAEPDSGAQADRHAAHMDDTQARHDDALGKCGAEQAAEASPVQLHARASAAAAEALSMLARGAPPARAPHAALHAQLQLRQQDLAAVRAHFARAPTDSAQRQLLAAVCQHLLQSVDALAASACELAHAAEHAAPTTPEALSAVEEGEVPAERIAPAQPCTASIERVNGDAKAADTALPDMHSNTDVAVAVAPPLPEAQRSADAPMAGAPPLPDCLAQGAHDGAAAMPPPEACADEAPPLPLEMGEVSPSSVSAVGFADSAAQVCCHSIMSTACAESVR